MNARSPLQAIYDRPGFLLKRCHQLSVAIFLEECSDFNLTPSQYAVLRALEAYPGIDQLAVGRLAGLDRSTVALVIRLLGERDLIEREVNDEDKRRMRLRLSPAGRRLLIDVAPAAQRAQEVVLAPLSKARRVMLLDLLREFIEGHGATIQPEEIVGAAACSGAAARAR